MKPEGPFFLVPIDKKPSWWRNPITWLRSKRDPWRGWTMIGYTRDDGFSYDIQDPDE